MSKFDIQELQKKFERWHDLHGQIQQAQEKWLEADTLLSELLKYYQSEQWFNDHDSNFMVDSATDMHSITSEDALWNALTEHREQAIRWMKLGLDAIEK